MDVAPKGNFHRLSDSQVAVALNTRVLDQRVYDCATCPKCALLNRPNHYDNCGNPGHHYYQFRHNRVRDSLGEAIKKTKRQVQNEPSINNHNAPAGAPRRRADLRVGGADGGGALDPKYGLLDIKIKNALREASDGARQAATVALDPTLTQLANPNHNQRAWAQLNAALDKEAADCRASYANAGTSQPIMPLIMSTGGTLHKDFKTLITDLIPAGPLRTKFYIEASLTLVRSRALTYPEARLLTA